MIHSTFPSQNLVYENKYFTEFIRRCHLSKRYPLPPGLAVLVKKADVHAIFDLIENDFNTKTLLFNMYPGTSYRFAKDTTGLSRTFNVIRSPSGEYALILETKSKLANHTQAHPDKQDLPVKSGTLKSGKPAWRIEGGYDEYFNLTIYLKKSSNYLDAIHEYQLPWLIDSPFVAKYLQSQLYLNEKGHLKISLYASKAPFNLSELLSTYPQLSYEQKDILISDLLKGIKAFHDLGYVHQDIKPENLLIYYVNGKFRLRLTDYGLSTHFDDKIILPLSSKGNASPEILYFHNTTTSSVFEFYQSPTVKKGIAFWLLNSMRALYPPLHWAKRRECSTPHYANDIWAAGIVIYHLLYGQEPTPNDLNAIQYHPLLKRMLHPDRNQRMTINEAINLHQYLSAENRKVEALLALPFNEFLQHPEISALLSDMQQALAYSPPTPPVTYTLLRSALTQNPARRQNITGMSGRVTGDPSQAQTSIKRVKPSFEYLKVPRNRMV